MRKKKGILQTIVVVITILAVLLPGQSAFAAEQIKDFSTEEIGNLFSNSLTENRVENEKSNLTELPVFLLCITDDEGDIEGFLHCFLAADANQEGNVYLLSSIAAYALVAEGLNLHILVDGELLEPEILGYDDHFAYLEFDGIESYEPILIGDALENPDVVMVQVMEIEDEHAVLGEYTADLDEWEEKNGYYNSGFVLEDEDDLFVLGIPVFDDQSEELVGMIDADWDSSEMICRDITQTVLDENYAVGSVVVEKADEPVAEEAEGKTEEKPAVEETEIEETEPEEAESETETKETETKEAEETEAEETESKEAESEEPVQEESGVFSSVPEWAYVVILVVILGAVLVSMNQKKKGKQKKTSGQLSSNLNGSEEGTIALDSGNTIMQEETGETMPEAMWQIRGMSGYFMGQTFALADVLRFGRNEQNHIVFPKDTKGVSVNHCELSMENGRIILRDLGSTYGTYLGNGEKLNERVGCELKEGDVFYLADRTQSFCVHYLFMED